MSIRPTEINSSKKLYALLGSPVQHSLSPLIHNTSFEILGLDSVYHAFDVHDLGQVLRDLKVRCIQGFNVTVPYKESVMPYLDELSNEVKIIGAVNTVVEKNGKWIGHNTDAKGFSRTLRPYKNAVANQNILLLGAGGSARAVLYALLIDYEPKKIFIFNRTKERALNMIEEFKTLRPEVERLFISLSSIAGLDITLAVNASSVGMKPDECLLGADFFKQGMIAYDLIYNPASTLFLRHARASGAIGINGLEMLIEQAAAAFEIWTGQAMPANEVRKKLGQKS